LSANHHSRFEKGDQIFFTPKFRKKSENKRCLLHLILETDLEEKNRAKNQFENAKERKNQLRKNSLPYTASP